MADRPPMRRLKDGPGARAWNDLLRDIPCGDREFPWARMLQALEETQAAEREECAALADVEAADARANVERCCERAAQNIAAAIRRRGQE